MHLMVSHGLDPASVDAMPALPLVSIGVPVRNGADHLAEALESVVAQDYPNVEVVICDNASGDDTPAVARRFVETDRRFRYVRNSTDIGFVPNFRRALDESRGTYFTWLAHDDLLSHPGYISTLVDYMERHPDVLCCTTSFYLSAFELAGSGEIMAFPKLRPDRWPASRRELFRWPHGWIDLTIYGMFRRAPLASIPFPERRFRGRPHIFWWETEVLTELSAAGRIVALPECLRTYRRATTSVGQEVVSGVSPFDMLLLGLQIKLLLLRRALTFPAPPRERVGLLATAGANLFRANLRLPYDHRREIRSLERQVEQLEETVAERRQLAGSLRAAVAQRLDDAGEAVAEDGPAVGEPPSPPPRPPAPPRRSAWRDFFQPPTRAQTQYSLALSEYLAGLRSVCDNLLSSIELLHGQAARLREVRDRTGNRPGEELPLVSVGMPVYNGEEHLAAAIESVLAQGYGNLEIVLVDNASTDATPQICRRFAEADHRVRYLRNAENIGFLPNFRRALDEARGKYFTWLAHDDTLSDPRYVRTVVEHLEQHGDVVCCHTAFYLLDNELPGSAEVMSFPELSPDRRWPAARRALFRWPHGWLDSVIYGVFRREAIERIRFPEWTYRGKPHIFCWEMDVLTELSATGRIVALPDCLRSYRLSTVSVGKQIGESVSSFDLLVLGMRMKLILIRRAWTQPAGKLERGLLLATVLANLARANFRQPYDHRTVLYRRERELEMLRSTAEERNQLVRYLRSEIAARRRIVESKGLDPGDPPAAIPPGLDLESLPELPAVGPEPTPALSKLAEFFRPLPESRVRRMYELSTAIGHLRRVCEDQSRIIAGLSDEAAYWLDVMHSERAR